MKYWLCITTDNNWNIIKDKKIWAVKEKDLKKLNRVAIGDILVFYVKQKVVENEVIGPKIRGIYTVVSEIFKDATRVFTPSPSDEKYVYKVKIRPVIIDATLDFKALIPQLKFIKNKKRWYLGLQVAMRNIPTDDYKLIMSRLNE